MAIQPSLWAYSRKMAVLSMGASLEGCMAVETTNTMIARGSATAPIRVVNVSAPVRASITCPPFRVSAPKAHVRSACGTPPSTTSIMPLDQVWCELLRTPLWRSSRWRESLHSSTPVGPGASDEGCSIVGYYAPERLG